MINKNSLIIGLVILVLLMAGSFVYQLNSNKMLKNELTQRQEYTDTKISAMKKELNNLREGNTKPNQVSKPAKVEGSPDDFSAAVSSAYSSVTNESTATQAESGPSLLITPNIFDLGKISKTDGVVSATFTLSNNGNSPLIISYAFSSCGCTVAPLKEEKILQPGESYPLEVTYNPNFYGPEYELGSIEKTITVISNYTARPFYKVKLKAEVIP